ncbi:MAG TPA: T9SS type A sorting domain-containing protein [Chitinophagaceae bacterium]|nr:T9SS type A sorting domain-containing protein [Chitinophagaceae bacterium]
MRQIYSVVKKQSVFVTALCLALFISTITFGQTTPICGANLEDFNNTGGTTANFTGGGFTYGSTGNVNGGNFNGFLQRGTVLSGGSQYTLTTPTYTTAANATAVGYGFDLTGAIKVSNVAVSIQYPEAGQIVTAFVANIIPSYSSTGPNGVASECRSISINSFAGFTPGENYRFVFTFTAASAGSTNETIIFDNFRTTGTNSQIVLPVTFTGLDAKKIDGGTQLTWKVAGEQSVKGYDVERSSNGIHFTKVGTVTAAGKDAYSFVDASTADGKVFYRIRNNDLDGRYKYSVVVVYSKGKAGMILKAFPLPAKNNLTLQHTAVASGRITLSSEDGRLVKTIIPTTGSIQTDIDLSALKAGMYLLRFDSGNGEVETLKVIKQ